MSPSNNPEDSYPIHFMEIHSLFTQLLLSSLHTHTHTHAHTHTHTHTYIYIYIYIYTHTHTHTHIYILIFSMLCIDLKQQWIEKV